MNRRNKTKNVILLHIENNLREYLIVSIIFIVGIIIGAIFVNNVQETQKIEISEYLNSFVSSLKENKTINEFDLLKDSLYKNLGISVLLWFIGSTVIGISVVYLIVGFRGFVLGYTISSSIMALGTGKGILFVVSSLLFQTILFIPCILALAVSGMKLHNSIMKDKAKENIKLEILRHTIFSLIILVVLLFSSIIEVYLSKNLLLLSIKYF